MKRRNFMQGAALATVGSALATPAIAQSEPAVKWRLTAHVPKSMKILWDAGEHLSKRVSDATDGKFQIQLFSAGELVAPLEAYDAIRDGTVEMATTSMQYFYGKVPSFALMSSMAFGMNTRQLNAWHFEGGGIDLINSMLEGQNLFALPAGQSGEQMGGWFRKEVNTLADMKGLRFRIPGIAGKILERIGVVAQLIPPGDIYPALERGIIDATEFTVPYDDEKLGFVKVAPYYYFPTMFEGGSMTHFLVNLSKWNELPDSYKSIFRSAAAEANFRFTASYDILSGPALKRMIEAGVQLKTFSPEIQDAVFAEANSFYAEMAAGDADSKKLYDALIAARDDQYLWHQVAAHSYDSMMIRLLNA